MVPGATTPLPPGAALTGDGSVAADTVPLSKLHRPQLGPHGGLCSAGYCCARMTPTHANCHQVACGRRNTDAKLCKAVRAVPAHQPSPTALFTLWGTTRGRARGSSGRLGNARWADGRPAFARTDLPGRWVGQGVNGQRPRCLRAASDRRRGPLAALPGQDGVAEGCDGRHQSCAAPTIAVRRCARPMQIAHGVPGNGPQARNRCARLCGARCTAKQENYVMQWCGPSGSS